MEEKELWMNKLKEKLSDYSEPTFASGWERLEKELMPSVEKKIYPYWKWTMAAAAVILLVFISSVSLYFLEAPFADEIRRVQAPMLTSVPDELPEVGLPAKQGISVAPVIRKNMYREDRLAKNESVIVDPAMSTGERVVKNEQTTEVEESESKKTVEKETSIGETNEAQSQERGDTEHSVGRNTKPRRPSSRDKYHLPVAKASSRKGTWSIGLGVGNSGGVSSEVASGVQPYMSRVSMFAVSNGLMEIPENQTLVFEDGVPYLYQTSQVVDIKHLQPISFGLSVRKNLRKGFSLESGLTYTLLSSDVELADNNLHTTEQKLHYIGIPLRANWNFVDKKLVTLYVSGGGMIEKCVYGKFGSEKENVKPLQFSVAGAVGAQLNVTKRFGVYIEPGVAYYFDDGSDVQTIRKENPFNFNIQAGVRLAY